MTSDPIKELQRKIAHHSDRGYTPIDFVGSRVPNFGRRIPVVWAEYRLLLNPEDKNIYHKNVVSGADAVEMCRELVEVIEMWEDGDLDANEGELHMEQQRVMHKYCGDIDPTYYECTVCDTPHRHRHVAVFHAEEKHDAETDEEIEEMIETFEGETIDTSPQERGGRSARV